MQFMRLVELNRLYPRKGVQGTHRSKGAPLALHTPHAPLHKHQVERKASEFGRCASDEGAARRLRAGLHGKAGGDWLCRIVFESGLVGVAMHPGVLVILNMAFGARAHARGSNVREGEDESSEKNTHLGRS